jgi:copper(I)-binding protein
MSVSTPARNPRLARIGAAVVVATTLVLAGTVSGCSSSEDTTATTASAASTQADHVTVADAWVKSAPSGMTAAFGTLVNGGDTDVRLESVTTELAAKVELHETVSDGSGGMTMRPKDGGFTIAAGKSHELAPGGDHIMMMGLTDPAVAGEEVELVLHFADGSTRTMTALVKDFTGADEKYAGNGSGSMAGMSGMSGTDGSDDAS